MADDRQAEYIQSILPKKYDALTLFIYFENKRRTFTTAFSTPLNIIRQFWQEHTKYAFDMDYPDVLSYLISRIHQMQYMTPLWYLENVIEQKADINIDDINNLAFLFLTNHCAIATEEIFGYVQLPEQRFMLIELLRDLKYQEEELYNIADDITKKSTCVDFYVRRYYQ